MTSMVGTGCAARSIRVETTSLSPTPSAPVRMALQIVEEAAHAALGETLVRHRRHGLVGIDLGREAHELALLLEIGDMGADRLVAHQSGP
jgi:hypothetical protein